MRVKLYSMRRNMFYEDLNKLGYNPKRIADFLMINERTVRDWKLGKYNIDEESFNALIGLLGANIERYRPKYVDTKLQKQTAGYIGGKRYFEKYGQLGSYKDKIKGGRNSYNKRKTDQTDIYTRTIIKRPLIDTAFAEFVGLCMGDGSISKYQVTISLNDEDDKEYLLYVTQLIEKLFGTRPALIKKKYTKCTNIVVSSVELVNLLHSKGLPIGDKLRAGLDIPVWIAKDKALTAACIKGLFDTDGSVFIERHKKGASEEYGYLRLSFVSASVPLLESVNKQLRVLGIYSKIYGLRCVTVSRFTDIEKYFRIVGSSNQKHLKKYSRFMERSHSG